MISNDNDAWGEEDYRGMVRMVPIIGVIQGDGEVRLNRPMAAILARPTMYLVSAKARDPD